MIIRTEPSNPGIIFFKLEEHDMRRRDENKALLWMQAIEELKSQIPESERKYDGLAKQWEINDSPENWKILGSIRDLFLIDKNQLSLI
jgi:hypothetical protein